MVGIIASGYWCGFDNGDLDLWNHKTNRIIKIKNFKRRISSICGDSFGMIMGFNFYGKFVLL